MKLEKVNPFSKDKKIKITGFRNDSEFEVESRWLWCEIIIKEIYCKTCKDGVSITFHRKDITKLIKALNKLLALQEDRTRKLKRNR